MNGLSPKGLLVRSTTFDDRKARRQDVANTVFAFQPLTKRSQTFMGDRKVTPEPVQFSDVLYRRYFGAESSHFVPLHKGMRMPSMSFGPSAKKQDEAVIVVDTFSTGAMLCDLLYSKGFKVIRVLSGDLQDLLDMVPDGLNFSFEASFMLNVDVESDVAVNEIIKGVQGLGFPVIAVLAGAETGVELADQLSERMGLTTNGTALSEARRNKYVMGETIRASGIRAVKQLRATTWGEIDSWIKEWNPSPFKVIVKPMDSAGSDDVTLCQSHKEVQNAFGNIMGKINGLGLVNKAVLVQEYLEGQEYVVDMVSSEGVHKVAAIWAYDRRPANGAHFVCFGQRLQTIDDPRCAELVAYMKKVVTALGIKNGPTHGEVKWFQEEPVLVEVGARCHGGDGLWLALGDECFGCNQAKCAIDSYIFRDVYAMMPDAPSKRLAFGALKWLVVTGKEGMLRRIDDASLQEILNMESYRSHQFFVEAGEPIKKTQNCFSWAGAVTLANTCSASLERDYARVEELEKTTLFDVDDTPKTKNSMVVKDRGTSVGVVDPFSTGAVIASLLYEQGYKVVAIYSANLEQLGNLQNLVPLGLKLTFDAVLGFSNIEEMLKSLTGLAAPMIAILAGAETGVELADQLSERMGLITNGTALSEARRNKYVMGETVRAAGVRAVKQLRATAWGEIDSWIKEWNPSPFKVIVKPMDSAGSDSVTLCQSHEEVKSAFGNIMGKINGLGLVNKAVLVQEYLEGQEYVVDMVSSEGVHKVAAIWAYDRRPANGAHFVCHGQRLLTIDDPLCAELVAYMKKVVTALGIKNGPTHGEVKWFKDEPVLVEVGARCHGAEGSWVEVTNSVLGYNQAECAIDSYLDKDAFDVMSPAPSQRFSYGRVLFICVNSSGTLESIDPEYTKEIMAMSSIVHLEYFLKIGQEFNPTIDCFTFGGLVKLVNKDLKQLTTDYERIRTMELVTAEGRAWFQGK